MIKLNLNLWKPIPTGKSINNKSNWNSQSFYYCTRASSGSDLTDHWVLEFLLYNKRSDLIKSKEILFVYKYAKLRDNFCNKLYNLHELIPANLIWSLHCLVVVLVNDEQENFCDRFIVGFVAKTLICLTQPLSLYFSSSSPLPAASRCTNTWRGSEFKCFIYRFVIIIIVVVAVTQLLSPKDR